MPPDKTPRERAEDLISLLVSDWRPNPRQVLWTIRIGIVLGLLVAIGYSYGVTLWDWIKLLIIPAAIAGAGLWFNQQQGAREQRTANERAQDEALQAYLDQMSNLILDNKLGDPDESGDVRDLARARTLTVLDSLDEWRRSRVLQFLSEALFLRREILRHPRFSPP